MPSQFIAGEPESQRIVVSENMLDCFAQRILLDGFRQLQQNRLVPMFRAKKVLFKKPMLNRCEQYWPGDHSLLSRYQLDLIPNGGKLGDGLILKQLLGSQVEACLVGSRDDLNAENGIATEFEEVVVNSHTLKFQYFGPNACQGLLSRRSGRQVALLEFWPEGIRNRQRPPIHLAVVGHRYRLQHHKRCRHHVLRQPPLHPVA